MNKPGGWTRIGIVISLIWTLATLAAACYEVFFTRTLFADYTFIDLVEIGPAVDGFTPVDSKLLLGRTVTLTLAPVLGFWTLTLASMVTYRWVRAGFKR